MEIIRMSAEVASGTGGRHDFRSRRHDDCTDRGVICTWGKARSLPRCGRTRAVDDFSTFQPLKDPRDNLCFVHTAQQVDQAPDHG